MNLNLVQECPNIDALILDTLLDDNTYIAVFDSSFKFVRASEAYEKTFEIPRSEIEGKHASEILGIEVFEQTMLPKLLRCLSGEVVQYESWLDYNIAGKRYVRVTYKPFKIEAEGKITHILSRAEDITPIKEAEESTQRNALRMQLANATANIGIWEYDFNTRNLTWDEGTYKLFGHTQEPAEDAYDVWKRAIHPEDKFQATRSLVEAACDRKQLNISFRIIRPDGTIRHMRANATLIRDGDTPSHIIGTCRDITEEVSKDDSLRESEDRARNALLAKSQFLNIVNHELRTPLNAILGPLELLEHEPLPLEARGLIKLIQPAAIHLNGLISQILTLSKLEAESMESQIEEIELEPFIHQRISVFARNARLKGIDFSCTVSEQAPRAIHTDPAAFTQILYNLVSNAIKFTSSGKVSILIESPNSDTSDRIRIKITDTGIGIRDEDISRILKAFEQVNPSPYSENGGTGLGLPIAIRLTDLLGGQITINSRIGEGSQFTVDLPTNPNSQEATEENEGLGGLRNLGIKMVPTAGGKLANAG